MPNKQQCETCEFRFSNGYGECPSHDERRKEIPFMKDLAEQRMNPNVEELEDIKP